MPYTPDQAKVNFLEYVRQAARQAMGERLASKYRPAPPTAPVAASPAPEDELDPETLEALAGGVGAEEENGN